MKTDIAGISIPKPCHESWADMTPAIGGRHCESCCKTVVDFTTMSHQQIIRHLSNSKNICGRIEPWQISSVNTNIPAKRERVNWRAFFVAACLITAPLAKTVAQHRPQAKVHRSKNKPTKIECYRTVSGKIVDSADRISLPGVVISVKGRDISAVADVHGDFTINVPESAGILIVKYSGYRDREIKIQVDTTDLSIPLSQNCKAEVVGHVIHSRTTVTGAIVVIHSVEITERSPFYKRWFHLLISKPIKKIFG